MANLYLGTLTAPTPQVFLTKVIEPVLCFLTEIPYSIAASQLLLGTAIKESQNFKYKKQLGGGPAVSFFQMEPATHNDIWNNFLKYKPKLAKQVSDLLTDPKANKVHELQFNDNYATAMARVHYLRAPAALPAFDDFSAQAAYWKQYYNTPLGKGTAKEYQDIWDKSTGFTSLIYKSSC